MPWIALLLFISGVGVGVVVGRRFKKPVVASVFTVGNEDEADELRAEAAESVASRIEKRKERILQVAREQGRITNDGVEELFCISDATAGNYLKQLVSEKRLIKVGTTGRGVYYEPVPISE